MYKKLIQYAIEAKKKSYSPYSNFKVGAAVLTSNSNIYTGTNIENSSYPATICAERVAISKAVSQGDHLLEMIVIVGDAPLTYPCGICRQFIQEFATENMEIVVAKDIDTYKVYKIEDLLPYSFSKIQLEEKNV